jgi:hypothetical protein
VFCFQTEVFLLTEGYLIVPCCNVCYDFLINTMFGSSLSSVACLKAYVLFTLCVVFVVVLLQVSLDCPSLIAPSPLTLSCGSVVEIFFKTTSAWPSLLWKITCTYVRSVILIVYYFLLLLPNFTGPCRGSFKKYFYNRATGQCERFTYGGCKGNENNFATRVYK